MQKLLQYKPPLTGTRVMLAFLLAVIADVVQIPVNYGLTFFPQLRLVNLTIDALMMILTIGLIGFNWVLLPCIFLEVLPISVVMPSWTAAVSWAVWRRRNETPQTAPAASPAGHASEGSIPTGKAAPARPEFFNPMKKSLQVATLVFNARTSGLWILIITAALIAGLIHFNHKKGRYGPMERMVQAWQSPATAAAVETPFEFVANSNPQEKPTVAVAPITIQAQSKRSDGIGVNPERFRFLVEEMFAKRGDVKLVQPPPAQFHQPVAADLIVFVTLLDMQDEAAAFKGYKIVAKTLETKCSLRVQIIKAADKSTVFATVLEGSQTDVRTAAAAAPFSNDRIIGAFKDALKELTGNAEFQTAMRGERPPR